MYVSGGSAARVAGWRATLDAVSDVSSGAMPRSPAIVLAGGLGTRFGANLPKQVVEVRGESLLAHSLRRYDEHPLISEIIVPTHPDWRGQIEGIVAATVGQKRAIVVDAGATRNLSVLNGLSAVSGADLVAVHDGVRPLVTHSLITSALLAAASCDAAIPVIPVVDPLVEVVDGSVVRVVDRRQLYRGQTPQVFRVGPLLGALTSDAYDPSTFATLFEVLLNHQPSAKIATVAGDEHNLKITSPLDHLVAEQILATDGRPETGKPSAGRTAG